MLDRAALPCLFNHVAAVDATLAVPRGVKPNISYGALLKDVNASGGILEAQHNKAERIT
jgi:hypothetical protein